MDGFVFFLGLILFVGALLWSGSQARPAAPTVVYLTPSEETRSDGSGCLLAGAVLLALLFVGVLA